MESATELFAVGRQKKKKVATVAPAHGADNVVPDKEDSGGPPLPHRGYPMWASKKAVLVFVYVTRILFQKLFFFDKKLLLNEWLSSCKRLRFEDEENSNHLATTTARA